MTWFLAILAFFTSSLSQTPNVRASNGDYSILIGYNEGYGYTFGIDFTLNKLSWEYNNTFCYNGGYSYTPRGIPRTLWIAVNFSTLTQVNHILFTYNYPISFFFLFFFFL